MVALQTPKLMLNKTASDFNLLGVDGRLYTLDDVVGKKGLLVMFICNHCPYVKAIAEKIVRDVNELKEYGVNSIAIMSNDPIEYEEDSYPNMRKFAKEHNFKFPYVIDGNQKTAKNYGAVCTPDFFGYNSRLEEQYRGRLDDSGMKNNPNATRELFNAMVEIAQTGKGPATQNPSIGCSIKWKR